MRTARALYAAGLIVFVFAFARDVIAQSEVTLTQQQQEAIAAAMGLPPGSKITLEATRTVDGGTRDVDEGAEGASASLKARGDKEVEIDKFTSTTPPLAGLGNGRQASGSDTDTKSKTKGGGMADAWKSPAFWVGVLFLLGAAGVGIGLKQLRPAMILGAIGAGLIAVAFFPLLLIPVLLGALLVVAGPYVWKELAHEKTKAVAAEVALDATKKTEALRAVVAGVDEVRKVGAAGGELAPSAKEWYERLKDFIASQADAEDGQVIAEIKRLDGLGERPLGR